VTLASIGLNGKDKKAPSIWRGFLLISGNNMHSGTNKLKYALSTFAVLVVVAYVANFLYAICSSEGGGTFGDTFGAANAFFSGGALVMLIYAVILQRDELSLIRDERDDTRKLLEGQEKINAQQKTALDRQAFEQSFFSILSLISQDRAKGTEYCTPTSKMTILGVVQKSVEKKISVNRAIPTVKSVTYAHKLESLYRLIATAHALLTQQNTSNVLWGALRSMIDEQTAFTVILFAANEHDDALTVLTDLGCLDYVDNEIFEILSHLLGDPTTAPSVKDAQHL
jgi:hypothetical protein